MRLCELADVEDYSEDFTKSELVDAIVAARGDSGDIPPSSPPGRLDGHSSGYSSDDGHDGGGEETDAVPLMVLRRRVTVQNVGRSIDRPVHGRSFSMNCNVAALDNTATMKRTARVANDVKNPLKVNALTRYALSRYRLFPNSYHAL